MNLSLRGRLTAATIGMTLCNAVLFWVGVYLVFDLVEERLLDSHLKRDYTTITRLYRQYPETINVSRDDLRVYVAPNGNQSRLPAELAALVGEIDEVFIDGRIFDVDRVEDAGDTFYFLSDQRETEAYEGSLTAALASIVAVCFAIAAWMNVLFARRIFAPISDLSARVLALDEGSLGRLPLAESGSRDEVDQLARAVNAYQDRIATLLQRERDFSGDVAHELRTPLMGIQGAVENLAAVNAASPQVISLTGRVVRGCAQMATLIDAFLYLARDTSDLDRHCELVDVDEVVAEQVQLLREMTEQRGVVINVHREGQPTVSGIPSVVRVVLGNLLRNAVNYTSEPVVDVFISGTGVVIQDYGPGIEPELQSAMFERFVRGARDDRTAAGSGIGLALVQRLCQQFRWSIQVASGDSAGTRIALEF